MAVKEFDRPIPPARQTRKTGAVWEAFSAAGAERPPAFAQDRLRRRCRVRRASPSAKPEARPHSAPSAQPQIAHPRTAIDRIISGRDYFSIVRPALYRAARSTNFGSLLKAITRSRAASNSALCGSRNSL